MEEFQKKLREKTPIGKLDEIVGKHPYQEKEPLQAWPNNTNPNTGEVGGPRGPEPTRYGDWERKGRVSDFWISSPVRVSLVFSDSSNGNTE